MALSYVQEGVIVQDEFAKFVTMGTKGQVELFAPVSDDQRIDFEALIKRRFVLPVAIQVKSSMELRRKHTRLQVTFEVSDEAFITHDLFYYFFAHLNPAWLGIVDPVFFVPSRELHRHVDPTRKANGKRRIQFLASMQPNSHDQWSPYRFSQFELGARILDVIRQGQRKGLHADVIPMRLFRVPGLMWGGL